MQSGNPRPFISNESVRHALDSMAHASSNLDSALIALSLVDEFLLNPDFPDTSHSREYALFHVLSSIITKTFFDLRTAYRLYPLEPNASRDEVLKSIEEDSKQGSQELIEWSWLFHHFVQVDLSISSNDFCSICHVDERTLRRYQARVTKQFTNLLIDTEWATRTMQRKRHLFKELPGSLKFPLIGRDAVLDKANEILKRIPKAHIQITGEKGVGKTVFVESLLAGQIDSNRLDQLIWINRPVSCDYVRDILLETLLPEQARIGLRDLLQVQNIAIVIDNIEELANKPSDLQELLIFLAPAMVVLTCNFYIPLTGTSQIVLDELDRSEAVNLIYYLFETVNPLEPVDEGVAELIWNHVGGNPLALQLTVKNWSRINEYGLVTNIGIEAIFKHLFASFDEVLQRAWVACAIITPASFQFQEIQTIWPRVFSWENVNRLVDHNLLLVQITSRARTYSLSTSAANFVRQRCQGDTYVQQLTTELLADMHIPDPFNSPILEAILVNPWLQIEIPQYTRHIFNLDETNHRWSDLRIILEREHHTSTDVNAGILYAICLRHLGESQLARSILSDLLKYVGQRGDFADQPLILKEMAVIERQSGHFENARVLIANAAQIAARRPETSIRDAIVLEQAQLAIDTRDTEGLDKIIDALPSTPKAGLLKSEAYLLRNDYESARQVAEFFLSKPEISLLVSAHIHDLLGRIYGELGVDSRAQEHFSWCLMILEKEGDVFSIARAQTNLGGVLIRLKYFDEARILLGNAKNHQVLIHDSVGLAVTRHNLKQIDIQIATC